MHKHRPGQDHICVPTARYPAWQDTNIQLLKTNLWQQQEAVTGSLPQPVLVVFQSWGWEVGVSVGTFEEVPTRRIFLTTLEEQSAPQDVCVWIPSVLLHG